MKIIYTTGVFDILHPGHLNILRKARALGDKLIVGVQSDESVFRQKGSYPIMAFKERQALLTAMPFVDQVLSYSNLDQRLMLKKIKPDIMVQSEDWVKTGDRRQTIAYLNKHNIKLKIFPYTRGISSTNIKKRIIDSENIFRNDLKVIKDNLCILPIDTLKIYEQFDPKRAEALIRRIKQSKHFTNPIIVAKYQQMNIVVDGVNRLEAAKRLGLKNILVNLVDYNDTKEILLTNNAHFLNIKTNQLFKLLHKKKIKISRSANKENLKTQLIEGKLNAILFHNNKYFSLGEFKSLVEGCQAINGLVNAYLGKYSIYRLSELSQDESSFNTKIIFRRFTIEDIVELINAGIYLNSGVTWHQVRNSIINFDLPLNLLRQGKKDAELRKLINKKIGYKKVRYYSSNVYVCND